MVAACMALILLKGGDAYLMPVSIEIERLVVWLGTIVKLLGRLDPQPMKVQVDRLSW